jgi:hypothetical protein
MMKNAMDSEYGIFCQLTIYLRKSPYQTWILFILCQPERCSFSNHGRSAISVEDLRAASRRACSSSSPVLKVGGNVFAKEIFP